MGLRFANSSLCILGLMLNVLPYKQHCLPIHPFVCLFLTCEIESVDEFGLS